MPIDTRDKRASALQTVAIMVMPTPSGTIGARAREQATWLYSGILAQIFVSGGRAVGDLYWSRNQ